MFLQDTLGELAQILLSPLPTVFILVYSLSRRCFQTHRPLLLQSVLLWVSLPRQIVEGLIEFTQTVPKRSIETDSDISKENIL
jgi:hypothetical protein